MGNSWWYNFDVSKYQKGILAILRIALGWTFFYQGIARIISPDWTLAEAMLRGETFARFFELIFDNQHLSLALNLIWQWGFVLIGLFLIIGLFVRLSASIGAVLLIFQYLTALSFPYVNPSSYFVDGNIIYALALMVMITLRTGRVWGLDGRLRD